MIDSTAVVTVLGPLPGFPAVTRVGIERGLPGDYHRRVAERALRNGIVQVTLRGRGVCRPAGRSPLPVGPGQAMLFHAELHPTLEYGVAEDAREPWDFVYLDLEGGAAREQLGDLVAARGHVLPLSAEHPALLACRRLLPRHGVDHRSLPLADAARLAAGVLAALAETPDEDEHRLVARAMAFMRDRLHQPVGVAQAARDAGVSREHLTRLFATHVGQGPAAWLRRQRLAAAAARLRGSRAPVAEIAHACGFAGAAHFGAVFRASTGMTPGAYRRSAGAAGW